MSYRPEYARQAQKLCQLGLNDRDLAFFFEVDEHDIQSWKLRHKEFRSAVGTGQRDAENTAERATFRGIVGGAQKVPTVLAGKVIWIEKYHPPNARAGLDWLARRKPEEWGGCDGSCKKW